MVPTSALAPPFSGGKSPCTKKRFRTGRIGHQNSQAGSNRSLCEQIWGTVEILFVQDYFRLFVVFAQVIRHPGVSFRQCLLVG